MRVDQVLRDPRRSLQEMLRALANNLTARDNFAPEGTRGHILTSNGADAPPSYQAAVEIEVGPPGAHTHETGDIVSGIFAEARLQGFYRGVTINYAQIVDPPAATGDSYVKTFLLMGA